MIRLRNWKWVAGISLLLIYIGLMAILLVFNAQSSTTTLAILPTAEPTLDNQQLIIQTRNRGRWMQTLYHIEQSALKTGWTSELNRQAGDVWWNMGDISRAIPYWSAALESIEDVDLLRTVANSYINLGQWTQARITLERLLDIKPDDEWSNYQMGLILAPFNPVKSKLYLASVRVDSPFGQVKTVIENVLNVKPEDPLISMRLGLALVGERLWNYAELAFQHASDTAYPYPEAMAYLAWVKSRQGKDGTAWIDSATRLAPDNAQVWYMRGLHFRARADYVESLSAIAQSVRLSPNNAGLYAELGTGYRLIGEVEQAEYWLDFAVSVSANTPEYQEILKNFYEETAYTSPSKILESLGLSTQGTDDPDLLSAYGWALHSTGESDAGLEQIERALEIDPINPRALFDKARIFIDTDRRAEAIPILQRVATTYTPYGTQAQALLAELSNPATPTPDVGE